jgi:hydrogenase nickel incorporation protein HypA/HybF
VHELSLAGGILRIVEQAQQRDRFARVALLRLAAGALAGVETGALRFALDAIAPGTVLDGAVIEIDELPGTARCLACGQDVTISSRLDDCPACGGDRRRCPHRRARRRLLLQPAARRARHRAAAAIGAGRAPAAHRVLRRRRTRARPGLGSAAAARRDAGAATRSAPERARGESAMCLAIPALVVQLLEGEQALVDLAGVRKPISIALVPETVVGDYVIVHVGHALGRIDPDEAGRTLALFAELAAAEAK